MPTYLRNKTAYHNYEVLDKFEAGIKLAGYEVKAIREGKGNLMGSYVKIIDRTPQLVGFNLPRYSKSGILLNYEPDRARILLLNRKEIDSLVGKIDTQGLTLVPLSIYTKSGRLKLSIGLAKGKKKKQRRQDLIKKQQKREIERMIRQKSI